MARSISEQELQLKKRARRRLVGAIVLVTAVAVVLPMVLDSEPKPVRQNVDIHIPSPEGGEFKPKTSEGTQQPPIKGLPESPPETPPADMAASAPPSVPSGESGMSARTPAVSPPRLELPPSPLPDLDRSTGASGDPLRLPPSRIEPAAPERAPPGSRPESPRSASGASKSKPEASARSEKSESARSASSAPASKPEASAARAGSGGDRSDGARGTSAAAKRGPDAGGADAGGYVVQVAALADAAKARQLQKQMSGAGLKTYTEVISTKSGEVTRVRAGPYATREAAEKARAQLKKAGLDGQVVAK
jgi:DedD protein